MNADGHLDKRRKLQRILRRRYRRVKPGANPGTHERSWAEYSGVDLTPSSDHQSVSRLITPIICIGSLIAVSIVVFGSWEAFDHFRGNSIPSTLEKALAYIVPGMLITIGALCLIVFTVTLARIVIDISSDP